MARILVVDDEDLLLYSLSAALKRDGAEVTAVANGADALREIRSAAFDICFLDVHLPDASGLELKKIMRETSPETRFIIMTAADLDSRQVNELSEEGYHFLPKPFVLKKVRTLVKELSRKERPAARSEKNDLSGFSDSEPDASHDVS